MERAAANMRKERTTKRLPVVAEKREVRVAVRECSAEKNRPRMEVAAETASPAVANLRKATRPQ